MFKIFSFGFSDVFNSENIKKIGGVMQLFLDNIDISEFTQGNGDTFQNEYKEENVEGNNVDFIRIEQYEDMYILNIDLRGIDLRELSIRYDSGVIEINLNRSEIQKRNFGVFTNNTIVKRPYSKRFEGIEDIDTSKIFKCIDNGILSIRMPKKYELGEIIEVDSYEEE